MSKRVSDLVSSTSLVPAPVVRFSIGAAEVAAADDWRAKGDAEVSAAVKFYRVLFAPVSEGGHEGDVAALLPFKDGAKRSNEQQAFYDFAQRLYLVLRCGDALAAMLKDANVKGETMVQRPGLKADGTSYKPMSKRALRDSLLGKEWAAFVRRLLSIKDAADLSVKVAAGEVKEGEAPKGEARSTKAQKERVIAKVDEAVKLLKRAADAEKGDGSIDPVTATKVAALLLDVMASNGLK